MQLSLSDLNLIYACTKDKTLMIDVQAREISEKDLEAGLRLAHPEVSYDIRLGTLVLCFSVCLVTNKLIVFGYPGGQVS